MTKNKEQEQRLALNLQEQVGPFYVGDSAPLRRFAKDIKFSRLLQHGRPKDTVWSPKAEHGGADYAPGVEQQASRMANGNPTATLDCFPFEHLNVTSMLAPAPSTDGYYERRLALILAHLLSRANNADLPWEEHQLCTTITAMRHAQQPHKENTRAYPSPIPCQTRACAKSGPATTDQVAASPSQPLLIKVTGDSVPSGNTIWPCPYRLGLRNATSETAIERKITIVKDIPRPPRGRLASKTIPPWQLLRFNGVRPPARANGVSPTSLLPLAFALGSPMLFSHPTSSGCPRQGKLPYACQYSNTWHTVRATASLPRAYMQPHPRTTLLPPQCIDHEERAGILPLSEAFNGKPMKEVKQHIFTTIRYLSTLL
jgi:hypothetical protein